MADKGARAFEKIAAVNATEKGGEEEGLREVQDFLGRFGYLSDKDTCTPGILDDETSEALEKYQQCQGLETTGDFDEATRDQITTDRCAFPDMRNGVEFSTTCAWDKRNLTFAFDVGTEDVDEEEEFQAVRNAFRTWAGVVQLTFNEVGTDDNPDILIGWRPADDPDLDMQGGALAHADFPPACGIVTDTLPKPVHFDDTEHAWSIGAEPNAFDVETVALHEIGHILGLAHTNVAGAVMFASVSSNITIRNLTQDDISGIQSLYPAAPPDAPDEPNEDDRCFIATAAYGSAVAPEVNFLRGIRDNVLRQMRSGREWFEHFEKYYYQVSPQIAGKMGTDPELRKVISQSIVEPWTYYLKLALARPDWDQIDLEGVDPKLREFLLTLREDMDSWLNGIELPQSFADIDPIEAVKELNAILTTILRSGGLKYLDEQVKRGSLPLRYEPEEEAALLDSLRQGGRREEEIQRILYGS